MYRFTNDECIQANYAIVSRTIRLPTQDALALSLSEVKEENAKHKNVECHKKQKPTNDS
jgi:hypothetical protein